MIFWVFLGFSPLMLNPGSQFGWVIKELLDPLYLPIPNPRGSILMSRKTLIGLKKRGPGWLGGEKGAAGFFGEISFLNLGAKKPRHINIYWLIFSSSYTPGEIFGLKNFSPHCPKS